MADFYKVLIRMNLSEAEGGVPTFLSTHPDPGDRYNAVLRNTKAWQDKLQLPSYKVNADSYLQMIDGMVYGEDPKQGYTIDNIFYHPELRFRFSFPAGWQLTNAPTQVTIQPSDGKALMLFTLSNQKTLQSAVDTTMAMYGLQLQRSEKKSVNGLQAIVTLAKQPVQDQSTGATGTNVVLTYFVQYGSLIYVFHGVSTEADFESYAPTMEASMKTFAQLTDQSKINVKPKRIHVRKVQRTGTMASVLSSFNMPQNMMEELSLLNNIELNETVQAGRYIKIIGE